MVEKALPPVMSAARTMRPSTSALSPAPMVTSLIFGSIMPEDIGANVRALTA
jgi:hypothetical protein